MMAIIHDFAPPPDLRTAVSHSSSFSRRPDPWDLSAFGLRMYPFFATFQRIRPIWWREKAFRQNTRPIASLPFSSF